MFGKIIVGVTMSILGQYNNKQKKGNFLKELELNRQRKSLNIEKNFDNYLTSALVE